MPIVSIVTGLSQVIPRLIINIKKMHNPAVSGVFDKRWEREDIQGHPNYRKETELEIQTG